jgi:hypothetical protein
MIIQTNIERWYRIYLVQSFYFKKNTHERTQKKKRLQQMPLIRRF